MQDPELQKFLLRVLHTLGTIGATTDFLLQRASVEAWPQLTQPQLEATLRSLGDASLAQSYTPQLCAPRWKITALGTAALQEANLA